MATEITYPNDSVVETGKGVKCTSVTHGSPGASCDCDTASICACCNTCSLDQQSIRYRTWDNPVNDADWTQVQLIFDWSVRGNGVGEDCSANTAYAEYSKNSGSTWAALTGFPKTITGNASGTSTTTLPLSNPWVHTQFRVRFWVESQCTQSACSSGGCSPPSCGSSNCTTSLDIDNLRLVGTYPIGACCSSCGTCTTGKTPSTCTGTFQGDGTGCSPNPCTQPTGACCDGLGGCTQVTDAACADTWLGCGTNCSPNPCALPTGSCCDAGECNVTTEAACTGTWTDGGSCDPNPCSVLGGRSFSFGF